MLEGVIKNLSKAAHELFRFCEIYVCCGFEFLNCFRFLRFRVFLCFLGFDVFEILET